MRIPVERIWEEHPVAKEVVDRLNKAGYLAVLVGGVVRDALLAELRGQPFSPQDVDIATSAPPEEIHRLFADWRVLTVGEAFGVVVVVGTGGRQYEVATFRAEEGYEDGRRPRRVRWVGLVEDLQRRDFTVNGLAATLEGEVIDVVGGLADLQAGIIRTIGDPDCRFSEDFLRMLRAVRFACQLDFRLEEQTKAAILRHADKILKISWERIRDELLRILGTPRAAQGIKLLADLGLLQPILPEIANLANVPQPEEYHPEGDVLTHTILALGAADGVWDSPILKLAILFHDVGKPQALRRSGGENMAGHCQLGVRIVEEALTRLRFSRRETEYVAFLVSEHMRVARLPKMGLGKQVILLCEGENEVADLSQFSQRFPRFSDLLRVLVCDAEASAHRSSAWLPVLAQTVRLLVHLRRVQGVRRAREFISGADILAMGEPPGPRVGQVLAEIHERILSGDITSREEALRKAAELLGRRETSFLLD
ncbi:MAG: CCA tRNA nucleotidyltransferase [Candidatus Bipolaricaulota bacterium]|nr:CCA tRNA nucleotidyltransferase [Candidatus Bipolaricaulota bacterium]MDW8126265.1 CCA tRNA nucleotidyltransferase [Candidatus Bipolaricaulota bacterium]